ncbi:MAG: OmpH family outer membrane protein [Saprospiraceae bacterium]
MKYFVNLFVLAALMTGISPLFGQRFALVDVNRILENLDDYKKAQDELDKTASVWKQEIAVEYDKIKAMYNKYQAEQVLLTEDQKKQREEEIMTREKEARKMQKDKFGDDGALFKKRQDLVKPIQDKVLAAIQDYAAQKGFEAIFDTSGSAGIIYYNKDLDKTEDILRKFRTTGK